MGGNVRYKWLAIAAVIVICVVALLPCAMTAKWVGHTDLQVFFVLTDADTGQPIPKAIVHVRAEPGGFCEETDTREFTITTDDNGHASHLCKSCMCFGSRGVLEDTFAAHLPPWWYHVSADGYASTEPEFLDDWKHARQVQRGKPFATIAVPIRLQKTTGTQSATPDPPAR